MISYRILKGSSAAAITKYVKALRDEEKSVGYYIEKDGGAPSMWMGSAGSWGLDGTVDTEVLESFLSGIAPDSTDTTQRGNHNKNRRLGYDFTIAAPKSVSICSVLDARILEAHDAAVQDAIQYIQNAMAHARLGKGGHTTEYTNHLIVAGFRHEDSRPVNGITDPSLHSHCVIPNLTRREDGTWAALRMDFGSASRHLKIADAAYKASLAEKLRGLGYDLTQTKYGFEISGITKDQIKAFSSRHEEIDHAASGGQSPAQRHAAQRRTRAGKTQLSRNEQHREWMDRIAQAGIAPRMVVPHHPTAPDHFAARAIESAAAHLGERNTLFSQTELELEALQNSIGAFQLEDVQKAIRQRAGGLLNAGVVDRDGTGKTEALFTTQTHLNREQEILHLARQGQDKALPLLESATVTQKIENQQAEQGFAFSSGQKSGIEMAMTTRDRYTGIVGAAGAGKTTSMRMIAHEYQRAGYKVVGLAPSNAASKELEKAGITSQTLASFLMNQEVENEPVFYILDEAGMVSARDMHEFLQKIQGDRALLVGDPKQLQSVEAGMAFQQLIESESIRCTNIDQVQRQTDPKLRELAQTLAHGKLEKAFDLARPYIHEIKPHDGQTKSEALENAGISAYLALSKKERDNTFLLAPTNDLRRAMNQKIRTALQEKGEIGTQETIIMAASKVDLTREQAKKAYNFQPGMLVTFSKSYSKQTKAGSKWVVKKQDNETVTLQSLDGPEIVTIDPKVAVLQAATIEPLALAQGDQVIFRGQEQEARNGDLGNVISISHDGRVEIRLLDGGTTVTVAPGEVIALDYSFARTIHQSQGGTVDKAIAIVDSAKAGSAEFFYVACTRQRNSLQIITDSQTGLEKKWTKFSQRKNAIAAVSKAAASRELEEARAAAAAAQQQEEQQQEEQQQAKEPVVTVTTSHHHRRP